MVTIPADIAAEQAQARLNVALSSIKANAEAQAQVANILQEATQNVPVSSSRGTNFNRTT